MKEEIKIGEGKLFKGDALSFLEDFDQGVDAIITDPPYNISRENNFDTIGRRGFNFGAWDEEFDQINWIKDAVDLLKKKGSIIIFNDWKNLGFIAKELEELGCNIKDLIRWIKKNPMPRNTDRRYVPDYEFAIWATKNGGWTFNKSEKAKYLRPEYKTSLVSGNEKTKHPTQKSLELIKAIVNVHTNKGDLVLDPFIGSGTTAIACEALGRSWIGVEKKDEYFNLAQKRIKGNLENE